ncbi:MAG: TldD/PmbA family protein [Candidatus Micrarchaeota archaeon]
MEAYSRDSILRTIAKLGEYAEARLEKRIVKTFAMKNGALVSAAAFDHSGVGCRFFNKGVMGFCSTSKFADLEKVAANSAKIVKRATAIGEQNALSKEVVNKRSYAVTQKQPVQGVSVENCVELLKTIDASLAELKVSSRFLSLELEFLERVFINTEGSEISFSFPRIGFHYLFTTEHSQRFWQKGACSGFETVKTWNLENAIATEAKEIEAANNTSERITGSTNVVVSPEIAGIIAHESCGHPYEADRILGREAAQAGESFLKLEMRGTKFSNECVTVIDDPTLRGSYGYFEFDDEGVKAKAKKLIDKGKVNALLSDRTTAAVLKEKSSGNARTASFDCEPLIRMSNTFFEPGKMKEAELISEAKNGIYLRRFMEWNIDDVRFNQKYVGCEAYKIENGAITTPVKSPIIEITTPQLYSAITGVANNLEFHAASCGKGEPMQGMPVFMGGPSLLLKGVNLK